MAETKTTTTKAPAAKKTPAELESVFGAQKTIEITEANGTVTKYLLQFPGTDAAQRLLANAQLAGQGTLDPYTYRQGLLKSVIVAPKGVDFDYFDEHNGFMELMDEADTFLFGKLDRSAE